MKTILLVLTSLIIPFLSYSQGFRYDTIPASKVNSNPSFRYDTIRTTSSSQIRQTGNYTSTASRNQVNSSSQSNQASGFKKENLVLGGTFGLYFGNYTSFNFSPQLGYRFSDYFTAGLGLGYSYYKEDGDFGYEDYTQNYLGGNLYLQLNPVRFLRLQVQPELYGFWGSYQPDTRMVACVLVGGGVVMPVGNNGGVSMMIYYDVVQDSYSPYGNQVFYSVGYTFGF